METIGKPMKAALGRLGAASRRPGSTAGAPRTKLVDVEGLFMYLIGLWGGGGPYSS